MIKRMMKRMTKDESKPKAILCMCQNFILYCLLSLPVSWDGQEKYQEKNGSITLSSTHLQQSYQLLEDDSLLAQL